VPRRHAPATGRSRIASACRRPSEHPRFQPLTISIPVTPAPTRLFLDQTQWIAAAPSPDVTFTTRDDGIPITNPSAQTASPRLSLRGRDLRERWQLLQPGAHAIPGCPGACDPAGRHPGCSRQSRRLLPDRRDVHGAPVQRRGLHGIVLHAAVADFIGVVTTEPIAWIELSVYNTYLGPVTVGGARGAHSRRTGLLHHRPRITIEL